MRHSREVTSSWQRSRSTCRPNETPESLVIVAMYPLVQRWLAAGRELRLERELAVLDGADAVTNLVTPTNPPIHPIPSVAPTAPGSAPAMTTSPTNPPIHRIPSAAPTAHGPTYLLFTRTSTGASTTTRPTSTNRKRRSEADGEM